MKSPAQLQYIESPVLDSWQYSGSQSCVRSMYIVISVHSGAQYNSSSPVNVVQSCPAPSITIYTASACHMTISCAGFLVLVYLVVLPLHT